VSCKVGPILIKTGKGRQILVKTHKHKIFTGIAREGILLLQAQIRTDTRLMVVFRNCFAKTPNSAVRTSKDMRFS
jgi:hypothetical protein